MMRLRLLIILLALGLSWAAPLSAAVINICGFETGDGSEAIGSSGTLDFAYTTVKRTGSYAFRVNPTTTAVGYSEFRQFGSAFSASWYTRFYFRYATKPAANDEPIFWVSNTGTMKLEVRLNSSGNLAAYDSAVALIATGSTVLVQDTWYRIEVRAAEVGAGATDTYEVKIDGVSELSGTGNVDLGASSVRDIRLGKAVNRNGNSVDFIYDDLSIDDSTYPGAGQVSIMRPNGDGAYTAWTLGAGAGADWENVDEIPHDSDTTYLLSTLVIGEASTVTLESAASAGISGTIAAVKGIAINKRTAAADGTFQIRLRANGTDSDSVNTSSSNTYAASAGARFRLLTTDPSDAGAWTTGDLDGLEVGVEEVEATDQTRVTGLFVVVDYVPAAGDGCTGSLLLRKVGRC